MTHSVHQHLCSKCVGNDLFRKWIRDHGSRGQCDFDPDHGRAGKVVSISDFADEIDRYFRENYQLGGEYYFMTAPSGDLDFDQRGNPYKEILQEDIDCSEELVAAIDEKFSGICHVEFMDSGDCFYKDDACYEPIADAQVRERAEMEEYYEEYYRKDIGYAWFDFCKFVKYTNRFFEIKPLLDSLFGRVEEYKKDIIKNLNAGTNVYRARKFGHTFSQEDLDQSPEENLGAPPAERTTAGRMNVQLIPVFYAAFNEETAIAEVRPSIHDQVAIGEFKITEEIKAFDFTAFDQPIFADDLDETSVNYSHTRYQLISQMEREISKPILPHEQTRDYIPTQIVAEYIKTYFKCDAVIYKSSLRKNSSNDNRNIVFLNRGVASFTDNEAGILKLDTHKIEVISDITYEHYNNNLF